MQYTGLKDYKEKEEIYEGDRIEGNCPVNKKKGYVKYYETLTGFMIVFSQSDFIKLGNMINIKVIGNIYDDKKMLKEE